MTQFIYYDGADVGSVVRLEDGIAGLPQAADGSFVTAGVKLDDSTGSRTVIEWQPFIHEETACSVRRTYTGFLTNMRTHRGPYRVGAGRVFDMDITDLNILLFVQPLRGASAKRPVETGNARLTWLLSSIALSGIVYDNGLVGNAPDNYDEADYTDQTAAIVLADLCVSSSDEVGRIFFVYYDHATGQPSLFIDLPTAAIHDSTLRISNDLSDVDSTTTFAPYLDPEVVDDGSEIYCAVFFKYKTGTVYQHNQTTHDTFFANGFHRQAVFETTRVGSVDTANRHALQFLAAHSGTNQTYSLTVQLPREKVNLLEAGHRVQCKFTHLPGLGSFTYLRCSERIVALTPNTDQSYDVQLKLTNKGITPAGGGGTGTFPHPPPAVGGIVQQVSGFSSFTFPAPVTAGDTLVFVVNSRGILTWNYAVFGYTLIQSQYQSGTNNGTISVYKLATGSEGTTLNMSDDHISGTWYELAGSWTPDQLDTSIGAGNPATAGAISVAANSIVFGGIAYGQGGAYDGGASGRRFTPAAGWIEDYDAETQSGGAPNSWSGHQIASGSITLSANIGPNGTTPDEFGAGTTNWAAQVFSMTSADLSSTNPPASGQWVYGEVVTMSGAVGTTLYPYAAGSLIVRVDGVLISHASYTETDPAAGTFTLAWTPDTDETVTVDYQGL